MASEQVFGGPQTGFLGFGLPAEAADAVRELARCNQHSASAELRQAVSAWLAQEKHAKHLAAVEEEMERTRLVALEGVEPADAHLRRLDALAEEFRAS